MLITGTCDSFVMQSFPVYMIGIGLSFLAVLLLFVGLIRNIAAFLIPHLIIQAGPFLLWKIILEIKIQKLELAMEFTDLKDLNHSLKQ